MPREISEGKLTLERSVEMKKDTHEQRFVWVKDKKGNEYVCRVMDLKDPKKVSKEDLKNCVDDASMALPIGD
jgi:hypothetical protein